MALVKWIAGLVSFILLSACSGGKSVEHESGVPQVILAIDGDFKLVNSPYSFAEEYYAFKRKRISRAVKKRDHVSVLYLFNKNGCEAEARIFVRPIASVVVDFNQEAERFLKTLKQYSLPSIDEAEIFTIPVTKSAKSYVFNGEEVDAKLDMHLDSEGWFRRIRVVYQRECKREIEYALHVLLSDHYYPTELLNMQLKNQILPM